MPNKQNHTDGQPAKISMSTCTVDDIARLRGVGPKTAAAVVEYRDKNGGIHSREDLIKIYGISRASADNLSSQIEFD